MKDINPIVKPIISTNSKMSQNGKGGKPRGKVMKPKPSRPHDKRLEKSETYETARSRSKHKPTDNVRQVKFKRQQSRDHYLLYYPRAGDEISDSESSGDETMVYQRHWFSGEPNTALNRSARLSQLRSQLRRRLIQLSKCDPDSENTLRQKTRTLLESSYRDPTSTARTLSLDARHASKYIDGPLLVGGRCGAEGCRQLSLPCTRHCSRHIMMNADQLLFEHCTAKFADNTQCCVPVFDVTHELPLCPEHARKKDNYQRKSQESKPKKARKKPVSPTLPRPKPKSRPKKRKRPAPPPPPPLPPPVAASPVSHPSVPLSAPSPIKVSSQNSSLNDATTHHHYTNQIIPNDNHSKTLNNLNVPQSSSNAANLNLGLGLGSLGLGGSLKVELSDHEVFASLDTTEHDFNNVLNNLPADAFNDLFIGKDDLFNDFEGLGVNENFGNWDTEVGEIRC